MKLLIILFIHLAALLSARPAVIFSATALWPVPIILPGNRGMMVWTVVQRGS